jgi:hypothetical protein
MTIAPSWPLNPAGPAQSEYLIHFCGRPPGRPQTPWLSEEIRALSPEQRLERILWEQQILGFGTFGPESNRDWPVVCLSESPLSHLQWLLQAQNWPPWGVILWRQWVYAVGGGPVWYARSKQYERLAPDLLPWAVQFNTDMTVARRNDWVHEREWRIHAQSGNPPAVSLSPRGVAAVLIGRPDWEPDRPFRQPAGLVKALPPLWPAIQRFYWDSGAQRWWVWDPGSQRWWLLDPGSQRWMVV